MKKTVKRNLGERASGWEGEKGLWAGRPEVGLSEELALSQELKEEGCPVLTDKDSRGWGR